MLSSLFQLSVGYLFFLISSITIFISIIAVLIVKKFIPLQLRYKENPVIGNISSLISIIYGVLVGITALYLINTITYVDDAVQLEANAVANIYRDNQWLQEPTRALIQSDIKNYIHEVITIEWPLMQAGKAIGHEGDIILDNIARSLRHHLLTNQSESAVISNLLGDVKRLNDARATRIHLSFSALTGEVWIVVFIGTLLTIGINYLFGMNLYMHIITISAAALMAASMIFLLISLDRPFQGDFVIGTNSFDSVLSMIDDDVNKPG